MADSSLPLEGETAIVTGAGRGIGRAIALRFAQAGATVVLASRTKAELDKTAEEAQALSGKALAVTADLTSKKDVDALVAGAVEATGRLDIVVNNAGVFIWKALAHLDESEWD